jgi:hypothetical protein
MVIVKGMKLFCSFAKRQVTSIDLDIEKYYAVLFLIALPAIVPFKSSVFQT